MIEIPLSNDPNVIFSIALDNQNCQIGLRQIGVALYLSLKCNEQTIVENIICNNSVLLPISESENDFKGKLVFHDTFGKEDPNFEGLGDRFKLYYLSAGEQWQPQLTQGNQLQ